METQIAIEAARRRVRSARVLLVRSLGWAAVAGGVGWSFVQPYRLTLLHPRGQGFWWLVIEPPLLVVAAGLAFALLVAPGLVADLEEEDAAAR